ncbi:hypothetical protein ACLKA7_009986 [Drosophila subpalustris]
MGEVKEMLEQGQKQRQGQGEGEKQEKSVDTRTICGWNWRVLVIVGVQGAARGGTQIGEGGGDSAKRITEREPAKVVPFGQSIYWSGLWVGYANMYMDAALATSPPCHRPQDKPSRANKKRNTRRNNERKRMS